MSIEQMREAFEAWMGGANFVRTSYGDYVNSFVDGQWSAWQAALNQPAAPAPKDAESVMALAKALCYADTKCVLQAETEDWDLRYREKEAAAAALKSAVAALVRERDDLDRRCSEYMEAGNWQARHIAELETQLAAQPVVQTPMPISAADALFLDWYDEDEPGPVLIRRVEDWHGINAAAQGEVKS